VIAAILASISCEKRIESAVKPPKRMISDNEILSAYKRWKAGDITKLSELIAHIGEPLEQNLKEGITTYSWCGDGDYWLFAGVDMANGSWTGVSVRSRY
jgi:hypothetical protein